VELWKSFQTILTGVDDIDTCHLLFFAELHGARLGVIFEGFDGHLATK